MTGICNSARLGLYSKQLSPRARSSDLAEVARAVSGLRQERQRDTRLPYFAGRHFVAISCYAGR
jgi:hypothetical protein